MYRYKKGIFKNYKFNTVKKRVTVRKKKITKHFCYDIFTFDIETTSAWIDKNGDVIGYHEGETDDYWNELTKLSLCYIWQFSINDTVYYGRELYEFIDLLKELPKAELIIWVHNLSFEMEYLLNLFRSGDIFARAPHKVMKFTPDIFPYITFRCTYFLTNLSLEKWGKQLGVNKKTGQLDYDKLRTPLTKLNGSELEYCEYDCLVVYHGILDHLKQYKDIFDIPLTSTGKVRRVVKNAVTKDKDYMYMVHKTVPVDIKQFLLFRDLFAGGYVHANRKYVNKLIKGRIRHADIASSYPFSLIAFKYPCGVWSYIGKKIPDKKYFDDRAYIIHLHMKNVKCVSWNTYLQASKCKGSGFMYDNGRVLAADELYITVTEQDLLTVLESYDYTLIESVGTYCCQKKYLPKILTEIILSYYHDKTALKGVEDPVIEEKYKISKQYTNSIFGMTVSSPVQSDVTYDFDNTEWSVPDLDPDKVNKKFDDYRRFYDKHYFLNYCWGIWCTAYSRRRLWQMILSCDKDLLYTDTDSIFFINDHNFDWFDKSADNLLKKACNEMGLDYKSTRPKDIKGVERPLGALTWEDECIQFKTLGAKKYLEMREDHQMYMTLAGVPKSAVKALNSMDDFVNGFKFKKDSGYMNKLQHSYLNNMPDVIYPDGYVSKYRFGINLRRTGYELSETDVYNEVMELMEGKIYRSEDFLIKRRGVKGIYKGDIKDGKTILQS